MKMLTKVFSILLAIAMMIPAVAAMAEEAPVITWLISCDSEVPTDDASIVQALRDGSGVNFQTIYVNASDYNTKLSAYIASGDLPDLFKCNSVTLDELKKYGAVLDMSSMLEEYAPNVLADGMDRLTFGPNQDGAVYGLPGHMSYPWMFAVRRDWMQNLGYDVDDEVNVITMTIDEFTKLMDEFTHNDPDQDGADDTFGFCAHVTSYGMYAPIFTAYGIPMKGIDSFYYDSEAGQCFSIIKHPNFLEAMEKMQYFYQQGDMDTEFAVVADASTEFQYLWNSTAGAASWAPPGATNNWLGRYTEEGVDDRSFVYVDITDNNGENGGTICSYDGAWVCVSAACKNPEAALQLINYMYSEEGNTLAYLGIEGVHYEWEDKDACKYVMTEAFADKSSQRTDGGWILWSAIHPTTTDFEIRSLTEITAEAIVYGKNHPAKDQVIYYGVPAIASELGSTITDVLNEMWAKIIILDGDPTELYNQYVEEYNSIGGLTLEEQVTEIYKSENGIA